MWFNREILWIGPRLSAMERLCLKSFVDVGYDVELYRYGDVEGVPDGVRSCDAVTILPHDQIFQRSRVSVPAVTPSSPTGSDIICSMPRAAGGSTWILPPYACFPNRPTSGSRLTWEFEHGHVRRARPCGAGPADPRVARACAPVPTKFLRGRRLRFGATGPFLVQSLVAEQSLQAECRYRGGSSARFPGGCIIAWLIRPTWTGPRTASGMSCNSTRSDPA